MEKNKSIDGLVSRSEKERGAAASFPRGEATRKVVAKPRVETKVAEVGPKRLVSVKKTVAMKKVGAGASVRANVNANVRPVAKKVEAETEAQGTEKPAMSEEEAIEDFLKPVQAFDFDGEELVAAKEPNKKLRRDMKKEARGEEGVKPKRPKKRRVVLWTIVGLLVILLGVGVGFVVWGNDIIAKITGGRGNVFDLFTFVDNEHFEPLKTDKKGRTNILAIGTSGYDMEGEFGGGVHDGAQLTDSIMVISLNQETGDFAMLSLPRDLKASPTCTATGKINEVYWCNNMNGDNEDAGARALQIEVGEILGLDFQYYAHLNWGSLAYIVDTLGGITVNLDEDINDAYFTGAVYQAGVDYEIDGEQAVGLARARHGTAGGDFSRGASQQKILIGIKNKVFEKKFGLSELMGLAGTLGDNLRTDFSVEEMKTLAHLTSEFDFETMRQVSLASPVALVMPGMVNEISYVLPSAGVGRYGDIQDYVSKMFSNDPRVYEEASILVLNGTGAVGLASLEQAALIEDGFGHVFVDDAPIDLEEVEEEFGGDLAEAYKKAYPEKVTLYVLNEKKAGTRKVLEERYKVAEGEAGFAEDLPEGVETECDFVVVLGGGE